MIVDFNGKKEMDAYIGFMKAQQEELKRRQRRDLRIITLVVCGLGAIISVAIFL